MSRDTATQVWAAGHSTHTLEALVALLVAHDIAQVADIRTVPRSRRLPHLDVDALTQSLPEFGVAYVWRVSAAGGAQSRALLVAGYHVCHISSAGGASAHQLTSFATVGRDRQITYTVAG